MKFTSIFCGIAALFAIGLSNAGATQMTLASGDTPVVINDESSASSTITVTGSGRILDVNALVNITHTWDADLLLSNQNGGSGSQNYTNTLFDDSAYTAINAGYAYAPYTGSFSPEQALSAFIDMDVAGDWTFTATDLYAGDTGVIDNWSLIATVPEPASLALVGLGMMGLAGIRRRRK